MNNSVDIKTKNVWVDYQEAYASPPDFKPPTSYADVSACTKYPNLNSYESRILPVEPQRCLLPMYDSICVAKDGVFTIVSNDCTGRLWYGNVFGFRQFGEIRDKRDQDAVYMIQAASTVTGLKLVNDDMLLFSEISGRLSLYSLHSEMRPNTSSGYALFRIGYKSDYECAINALDVCRANEIKAVAGSKEGTLRIYDLACSDLQAIVTRRKAHDGNITGLSTSATDADLYVTSSDDRSILIWDERHPKPATAIFENHSFDFTSVYWTTEQENCGLVIAGDSGGWVRIFDTRKPNEVLGELRLNTNIISGMNFMKNKAIITSSTRKAEVYEFNDSNISKVFEAPTTEIVRSGAWTSDKDFNVVGWNHFTASYDLTQVS